MELVLSPEEEQKTKQFMEIVNLNRNNENRNPVTWCTAVKFLSARKFDVSRAVALYDQHQATRMREGLDQFDPATEPLKSELDTAKFTILPSRDPNGAAIAVFTARVHSPQISTHQTTLQGIVYQLDVALENVETQRAGLVFIYDMSDSKYSNFDYDLSKKILMLLKGGFPAKLKKVLIVTAPLWFKAPFKILRLFVREKLRDRVYTVSVPQLALHIPREALPLHLGGTLTVTHDAWLSHCRNTVASRNGAAISNMASCAPSIESSSIDAFTAAATNGTATALTPSKDCEEIVATAAATTAASVFEKRGDKQLTIEIIHQNNNHNSNNNINNNSNSSNNNCVSDFEEDDEEENSHKTGNKNLERIWNSLSNNNTDDGGGGGNSGTADGGGTSPQLNALSSASSGFSDDDSLHCDSSQGLTIEQFIKSMLEKGRHELTAEYLEIKSRSPEGSFVDSKFRSNQSKNRYTDVLCYDHTRVMLSQIGDDPSTTYINANFVDGYKQKNAFISTQGPLPRTCADFWRMIWEQHVLVIVMTTRVLERGRVKCAQYWPEEEYSEELLYHPFRISNYSVEKYDDYVITELQITNMDTDETRDVTHFLFTSWPDYGVPHRAMAMLDFLSKVRQGQMEMLKELGDKWAGHARGPPIVVHCSAGIGRTGTFCTLDICISRLEDTGLVDIRGTVEKIRSQRAYSIQMPDQYIFCHLALIEYAYSKGIIDSLPDLKAFDIAQSDESD